MNNYKKIKKTVINIGSGNEISIDDLAKKIINIVGIKVKISYDNSKPKMELDLKLLILLL